MTPSQLAVVKKMMKAIKRALNDHNPLAIGLDLQEALDAAKAEFHEKEGG